MLRRVGLFLMFASACLLLPACGGGGGGASAELPGSSITPDPAIPAKVLSWQAPVAYTDGTPLNPATDLQSFEIYVKDTPSFGPADTVDASVSQKDSSFNLALLYPGISRGATYYVSVRAVTTSGAKSDFSPSAAFSL